MDTLVATLAAWIVANTKLAAPPHPPQVLLVPEHKIVELYYRGRAPNPYFRLEAFYSPFNATIYLRDTWRPDIVGKSVLLHEIGHNLQRFNRVSFHCRAAAERQAYDWQFTWLREQGVTDPYVVMGIDEFTIRIAFACPDEE